MGQNAEVPVEEPVSATMEEVGLERYSQEEAAKATEKQTRP